jgi:excisionase family DNA binding protein
MRLTSPEIHSPGRYRESPRGAETVPPRLLTVPEVAEILRVSRDYVYSVQHRIGRVRLGRAVRFRLEDVERFIRSQAENTPMEISRLDVRKL